VANFYISYLTFHCVLYMCLLYTFIYRTIEGHDVLNLLTTYLLECNLDWNTAINCKNGINVVYLDFAKAFDLVVNNKLIAKLR